MTSISRLRTEAADCTRCDLYRDATQTVVGEGIDPFAVLRVTAAHVAQ